MQPQSKPRETEIILSKSCLCSSDSSGFLFDRNSLADSLAEIFEEIHGLTVDLLCSVNRFSQRDPPTFIPPRSCSRLHKNIRHAQKIMSGEINISSVHVNDSDRAFDDD